MGRCDGFQMTRHRAGAGKRAGSRHSRQWHGPEQLRVRKCTSASKWGASSAMYSSERTTPFTCGCQASVATRRRIRRRPALRRARRPAPRTRSGVAARLRSAHRTSSGCRRNARRPPCRIDPVAGIDVGDAGHLAQGGVVDMAADHPVRPVAAGLRRQELLEASDIAHGVLHLQLGPGRKRPVGQSETPADDVQVGVHEEREGAGAVAEQGEPARMAQSS